jgi:hypothetical protein
MAYRSTARMTSPTVFVTTESGLVMPIQPELSSVAWQVDTDTVDVYSIGSYSPTVVPLSTKTEIEISAYDKAILELPDSGIINFAQGNYAYTVSYFVESKSINFPDHEVVESTYTLIAMGQLLEGEHASKIKRVRFDVGDGTFRVLYALESEVDRVIERWYNQQGVNQWM